MRTLPPIYFILVILLLASCKKTGEQFDLQPGQFPATSLTATRTDFSLSPSTDNDTAVSFRWNAADFKGQPVISYTLQLDTPDDTAAYHWATAKSFPVPAQTLAYGFIGKDLNNLLNAMGLEPGMANPLVVRIRADVNQYNGASSTIVPVYSNAVTLQVTPYGLSLYVPGEYQNWDPASALKLAPVAGRAGLYEGYVNMPGSGIKYFKYTNAPDWDHTNYGDGGNGTFSTDGLAGGLSVPDGGYYYLTADLNTNKWTATPTSWGIIGDATPGGWDTDTPLTYDVTGKVWTVTADMVSNGSFKFRANNAWAIDFGIDNSGTLLYADNPFLGYDPTLNNLSVTESGNYTITLDLHDPGHYTYILHKN